MQTATKGMDVFSQILSLRTEAEQVAMTLGKRAPLAREAINLLYCNPVVDAADLEKTLDIATPTANRLISSLIDHNILKEVTEQ